MAAMKCPDCGSSRFYIKDPDDQFNISEFEVVGDEIVYLESDEEPLPVEEETETYCDTCAWHDIFKVLKK